MLTFGLFAGALAIGFVIGILVGRKNAGLVEQAVSASKAVADDVQKIGK